MRKLLQIAVVVTAVMMAGCAGVGSTSSVTTTPGGINYVPTPTNAIPHSG